MLIFDNLIGSGTGQVLTIELPKDVNKEEIVSRMKLAGGLGKEAGERLKKLLNK